MVPTDQVKLLGIDAAKLIFGLSPLQTSTVTEFVTTGAGLTVIVRLYDIPEHPAGNEVGTIL
jgi:hypothetical protein